MTESAKPEAAKTEWTPVSLLEDIKEHGRVWEDLANQYGVTNPDPPWKTSLDGMCEVLGAGDGSSCDWHWKSAGWKAVSTATGRC
jgi:hypothetical protein